jgi:superfamily II DNA or RNA helicase
LTPNSWFNIRAAKVFQPIAAIDWVFSAASVSAGLDPQQPSVDFQFPVVRSNRHEILLAESSTTIDLIEFRRTGTVRKQFPAFLDQATVSENLFEPLRKAKVEGKAYAMSRQELLFQQETPAHSKHLSDFKDKDGFRKSYSVKKYANTTIRNLLSIWDLVFPILQPPLSLGLSGSTTLPHDLYPYQNDGVKFLAERDSALLGDDMGTGKTIQTIVAMRMLFQNGTISSALIIVPLVLLRNWDRELLKWAEPLSGVTVVRGTPEERQEQWQRLAHVYIATFGNVRTDIEHIRKHRKFDLIVIDEIQKIKNRDADQTKAIKGLPRKKAWGLSGTPIENRIDDLVSIFEFLKPGLLPIEGTSPLMAKQKIKPYFLRRRKKDVLPDLPDKLHFEKWLDLEGKQRAAYEDAETKGIVYLKELGHAITVTHVLDLLQRLKKLCNRDPQSEQSAKLEFLKLQLDEHLPEDCKALVFTQFLDEGLHFIEREFKQFNPAIISGEVSGKNRDREVDKLQEDDSCRLFIATPMSGGVGLNLVRANYVFHFDHWWNPATASQAEDRAHRIGQKKDVLVYHLWTVGTVEERIYMILEAKKKLFDDIIDDLSNVEKSGLSEAELFGLFGLKAPEKDGVVTKIHLGTGKMENIIALGAVDFEKFVARVYDKHGYGTRLTPASHDGGIDIEASRTTNASGRELLAIQCKCFTTSNNVGRPDCQKLVGVVANSRSYTKGIIVTTSDFTPEAIEYCNSESRIEMVNGKKLMKLITEAGISLQTASNL